jgi:hypothetical protein
MRRCRRLPRCDGATGLPMSSSGRARHLGRLVDTRDAPFFAVSARVTLYRTSVTTTRLLSHRLIVGAGRRRGIEGARHASAHAAPCQQSWSGRSGHARRLHRCDGDCVVVEKPRALPPRRYASQGLYQLRHVATTLGRPSSNWRRRPNAESGKPPPLSHPSVAVRWGARVGHLDNVRGLGAFRCTQSVAVGDRCRAWVWLGVGRHDSG